MDKPVGNDGPLSMKEQWTVLEPARFEEEMRSLKTENMKLRHELEVHQRSAGILAKRFESSEVAFEVLKDLYSELLKKAISGEY